LEAGAAAASPLDPHYRDSAEASELKTKKAELRKALSVLKT